MFQDPHDPEIVAHVARIGAECGADIVKTVYTGDVDSFCKNCKKYTSSHCNCRWTKSKNRFRHFTND